MINLFNIEQSYLPILVLYGLMAGAESCLFFPASSKLPETACLATKVAAQRLQRVVHMLGCVTTYQFALSDTFDLHC